MQDLYAHDLALWKMSALIQNAELERAASEGRSARPSRPGPRARVRAAFAALRGDMDPFQSLTTQRPSSTMGS